MRRIWMLAFSLASSLPGSALAGEVRGTILAAPGAEPAGDDAVIVVWIEGPQSPAARSKIRHRISQKGMQFVPALQVLVAGEALDMPNDDNVAHNVFSYSSAKKFNLGLYPKGDSKEVVFEQAGVVDVYCSIHRQMKAKVIVVPNRHYHQGRVGESFTIANVPSGTWIAKVWQRQSGVVEQSLVVPAKGSAKLDLVLSAPAPVVAATVENKEGS